MAAIDAPARTRATQKPPTLKSMTRYVRRTSRQSRSTV
jgi:hypothetical protein